MSIPPGPDGDEAYELHLHEIKNSFAAIMGTTQLLERRIWSGREVSPAQILILLGRIRQQTEVAYRLVQSLGHFHPQQDDPSTE
jgi:nitrogen-specific signal transduction histidine kinase